MKLGVLLSIFRGQSLEKALDSVSKLGLDSVELPVANYVDSGHFNIKSLLNNSEDLNNLRRSISERGLEISAIAAHGNPIHPDKRISEVHHDAQKNAILLAEKLEVERVTLLSGCPGDSNDSKYVNWVSGAWPSENIDLLEWQWNNKVLPFWKKEIDFAEEHGVSKLCIEMHPNCVVYNPKTLLKLRNEVGKTIGCNFDPSHLFWQGIDVVAAIRALGNCIYHAHAKDIYINAHRSGIDGMHDTTSFEDWGQRSWQFRTIGYGHDLMTWRNIMSAYRTIGYDYVQSIEHEDPMASVNEGLNKAVQFLKLVTLTEKSSGIVP